MSSSGFDSSDLSMIVIRYLASAAFLGLAITALFKFDQVSDCDEDSELTIHHSSLTINN